MHGGISGVVSGLLLGALVLAQFGTVSFAQAPKGDPAVAAFSDRAGEPEPAGAAITKEETVAPSEPFTLSAAWDSLKSRFKAGGGTMWAILAASILGLASLLERIFRLRRNAFVPAGLAAEANRLWKAGKFDELDALCEKHIKSTLARIIRYTVRKRRANPDLINKSIDEIGGRDLTTHQMLAYPMLAIATICPLFGLLGTVIGIIETFEMIALAGAMGDPSMMAAGISKALVCTAFGLVVAIPMLFAYNIIKMRTLYFNRLLEEEASFLISEWFAEDEAVRR
jgi:biopolymer transport protein ExbB